MRDELASQPAPSEGEPKCDNCEDTGIYEEGDEWAPCNECDLGRNLLPYFQSTAREASQPAPVLSGEAVEAVANIIAAATSDESWVDTARKILALPALSQPVLSEREAALDSANRHLQSLGTKAERERDSAQKALRDVRAELERRAQEFEQATPPGPAGIRLEALGEANRAALSLLDAALSDQEADRG